MARPVRVLLVLGLLGFSLCLGAGPNPARAQAEFASRWHQDQRTQRWIGPDYWANRLQDWELRRGRLECLQAVANKPMRTVHLLTRRLGAGPGELRMEVRAGLIDSIHTLEGVAANAAVGFLLGAGPQLDYRAAALVHHTPGPGGGYFAGVNAAGEVFIKDFQKPLSFAMKAPRGAATAPDRTTPVHKGVLDEVNLLLTAKPAGNGYRLQLEVTNRQTGQAIGRTEQIVPAERFQGNLALVSHPGGRQSSERFWFRDWDPQRQKFQRWAHATARFWFQHWQVSGSKLEADDGRRFGPVVATQYTLHQGTLQLTAQLVPLAGLKRTVRLQVRPLRRNGPSSGREAEKGGGLAEGKQEGQWQEVAQVQADQLGCTALFRVPHWDDARDWSYRVVADADVTRPYSGKVRRDPRHQQTITLAAFTGNMMVRGGYEYPLPYGVDPPFPAEQEGQPVSESMTFRWSDRVYFPHREVVHNVRRQRPDLLFFSGDQVYEGNPTRAQEHPLDQAHLDYLYKWYLWCWTWRDLTAEIPTVTIPDDHDVYQRNIWGAGGEFSPLGDLDGSYGGYFMDPQWINMIQRTQTSHLPPPYDDRPVKNRISVYYTALTWGEIGFAILEDRKFKSFPTIVDAQMSRDSHITQKDYDIRQADVPNATLLGERQLRFLKAFAKDWRGQQMKAALSQTIFANLQILNPRKDGVPQDFSIPLDRDLDSNGWPQTGRRKALEAMRRGFLVHIAGDQHLASTIHHGTEQWEDSCVSLCVPSVANYYARSWNPKFPPEDPQPGTPRFLGRYRDGFGNRLTIQAVANPDHDAGPGDYPQPLELHREVPGYGIARFDKAKRTITLECWSRYEDPQTGRPYPGWPVVVQQEDNYAAGVAGWLPEVSVTGLEQPVVQVISEQKQEVVYTLRVRGTKYRPRVFATGTYTLRVGDPDRGTWKQFSGLKAALTPEGKTLDVRF